MKTRLLASLTAGMMLLSAVTLPPVQAAVPEDQVIGTLPDWVPQDFADALQFYNTHGKSYVHDNVICLVRPMIQYREDEYSFSLSGSMTMVNTPAAGESKIYELEIPEKPDPEDPQAVAAYEAYCERLGIYSHDYSFFETYAVCKTQQAFEVELFRVLENYDLTVSWTEKYDGDLRTTETFSFANTDGTTTETDLYGWLPDSAPEFNDFLMQYGRASVHGNYIAYCADLHAAAGEKLVMTQSGEGSIKEVLQSYCMPFELEPLDGSGTASVILYQPVTDGQVNVEWGIGRQWSDDEPEPQTSGIYEIQEGGTVIRDFSPDRKGSTVFTFVDQDTGALTVFPDTWVALRKDTVQAPHTSEMFEITSNPCTVDSIRAYDEQCNYAMEMDSDAGYYTLTGISLTNETSDCIEVTCTLKWNANGDADGNGELNTVDAVLLQRWLHADPDAALSDWTAMDLYRDGRIDVLDLCMLKRLLLQQAVIPPDIFSGYGGLMTVTADSLFLYTAPDDNARVIAEIPRFSNLFELGYMEGEPNWLYTRFNGLKGWIRTVDDSGAQTVFFDAAADKPVIYLYPEQETDVHVELELTESTLSTTYPKYQDGWDITAFPDGTLLNKADGTHHRYLFWDSVNCRTRFDFTKGFCVAGSDTEAFLKEQLTRMGLTESEMNEFIVYWLPRMEHNRYNLIAFQGEAYTDSARLHITPEPDSILRVFMAYVPLEHAVETEPQEFTPFVRNGFTVVEWGGSEIVTAG